MFRPRPTSSSFTISQSEGWPVEDLIRLNMLFGPYGRSFSGKDYLASVPSMLSTSLVYPISFCSDSRISEVLDLYTQRVRRVQVTNPRAEAGATARAWLRRSRPALAPRSPALLGRTLRSGERA